MVIFKTLIVTSLLLEYQIEILFTDFDHAACCESQNEDDILIFFLRLYIFDWMLFFFQNFNFRRP